MQGWDDERWSSSVGLGASECGVYSEGQCDLEYTTDLQEVK